MNYLKKYIYPWFVDAASLASIIGLIIAFASNNNAISIALFTFCLVLIILLIAGLFAINKIIIRNYPAEYKKVSSFYIFQCDDGIHSTFETYRLIQCKRPLLTELNYRYRWSGSISPKISSENQLIDEQPNKDKYQTISSATFNQKYKQFFYVLSRPDAGYIYRIEWEK